MNRHLVFFGAGVFALIFSHTAGAVSESMPSCVSMGYNKTASECDGYARIKCPWNNNAYFCAKTGGSNNSTSATVDCENRDCATLGYNKTADECTNSKKIPCPFDNTKYFCGGGNCAGDGYTKETASYNAGTTSGSGFFAYTGINGACGSGYQTGAMYKCPFDQSKAKWTCKTCAQLSFSYSLSECNSHCLACTECPYESGKYKCLGYAESYSNCEPGMVLYSNNLCYQTGQTMYGGAKPVGIVLGSGLVIDLEENTPSTSVEFWYAAGPERNCPTHCGPGGYPYILTLSGTSAFYNGPSSSVINYASDGYHQVFDYAYKCTNSYCSHLTSEYTGKWFLPSKADLSVLKSNISAYISGMALAGRPSSVTSVNDNKIKKIAIRLLGLSGGSDACCHRVSGTGGPDSGYQCNQGAVVWRTGEDIPTTAQYKRCFRTINQTMGYSLTYCPGGGTNTNLCNEWTDIGSDVGSGYVQYGADTGGD